MVLSFGLQVVVFSALSVALGAVATYLVEEPFMRLRRKLLSPASPPAPVTVRTTNVSSTRVLTGSCQSGRKRSQSSRKSSRWPLIRLASKSSTASSNQGDGAANWSRSWGVAANAAKFRDLGRPGCLSRFSRQRVSVASPAPRRSRGELARRLTRRERQKGAPAECPRRPLVSRPSFATPPHISTPQYTNNGQR